MRQRIEHSRLNQFQHLLKVLIQQCLYVAVGIVDFIEVRHIGNVVERALHKVKLKLREQPLGKEQVLGGLSHLNATINLHFVLEQNGSLLGFQ